MHHNASGKLGPQTSRSGPKGISCIFPVILKIEGCQRINKLKWVNNFTLAISLKEIIMALWQKQLLKCNIGNAWKLSVQ